MVVLAPFEYLRNANLIRRGSIMGVLLRWNNSKKAVKYRVNSASF